MNTFLHFLSFVLVSVAAVIASGQVQPLVLRLFRVGNIANPVAQRFVRAALSGFVITAMFAIAYAIIGFHYTLATFLLVWLLMGVLEFLLRPSER